MHTATSAMPNAIHGAATIRSAPVIRHLSSSQAKPPRLHGECARCGGQMEMNLAGMAVLHTVSTEAAWRLQKVRVR
jgi:hypothetical protein